MNEDSEIKLCKDCKHCQPNVVFEIYDKFGFWPCRRKVEKYDGFCKCKHPENIRIDLVTGEQIFRILSEFCSTVRITPEACSAEGKWFEAK